MHVFEKQELWRSIYLPREYWNHCRSDQNWDPSESILIAWEGEKKSQRSHLVISRSASSILDIPSAIKHVEHLRFSLYCIGMLSRWYNVLLLFGVTQILVFSGIQLSTLQRTLHLTDEPCDGTNNLLIMTVLNHTYVNQYITESFVISLSPSNFDDFLTCNNHTCLHPLWVPSVDGHHQHQPVLDLWAKLSGQPPLNQSRFKKGTPGEKTYIRLSSSSGLLSSSLASTSNAPASTKTVAFRASYSLWRWHFLHSRCCPNHTQSDSKTSSGLGSFIFIRQTLYVVWRSWSILQWKLDRGTGPIRSLQGPFWSRKQSVVLEGESE